MKAEPGEHPGHLMIPMREGGNAKAQGLTRGRLFQFLSLHAYLALILAHDQRVAQTDCEKSAGLEMMAYSFYSESFSSKTSVLVCSLAFH